MTSICCSSSRSTRCGTPVSQPLSVMNSVKAKDRKRFVAGKGGVRGLIKKGFCVVVPDTHDLWCALCRLVWVVTFDGKKLCCLEFMLINVDFAKGLRLLDHL